MTRGVNDSDSVLGGLELPESNVDGDTTFSLGLELVQNPGILEGSLSEFGGFLFELYRRPYISASPPHSNSPLQTHLLDSSLVNSTALVDHVSGGSTLS